MNNNEGAPPHGQGGEPRSKEAHEVEVARSLIQLSQDVNPINIIGNQSNVSNVNNNISIVDPISSGLYINAITTNSTATTFANTEATTTSSGAYNGARCSSIVQPTKFEAHIEATIGKIGKTIRHHGTAPYGINDKQESSTQISKEVMKDAIVKAAITTLNNLPTPPLPRVEGKLQPEEDITMKDAGWKTATGKKTFKRQAFKDTEPEAKRTQNSNRYQILENCVNIILPDLHENLNSNQISNTINDFPNNQINNDKDRESELEKENVKNGAAKQKREITKYCPPIITKIEKIKELTQAFKKVDIKYKIKILSGNKLKIYIEDKEDHHNVVEIFNRAGIESYTYTPKGDKPISILLKGVHSNYDESDIKQELVELFPEINFEKVSRFETTRSKDGGYKLNMFIVQVAPGSDITNILKTRTLLEFSVQWEKPRSYGPVQCKRCQNFGHIAQNCTMKQKCVKCVHAHPQGECTVINKSEGTQCVNCGQIGHPANYRGCPYYKKYIKERKSIINNSKIRQQTINNNNRNIYHQDFPPLNPVVKGKTFAEVIGKDISSKNQRVYSDFSAYPTANLKQYNDNDKENNIGDIIGSYMNRAREYFNMPAHIVIDLILNFERKVQGMSRTQAGMAWLELTAKLFGNGNKSVS